MSQAKVDKYKEEKKNRAKTLKKKKVAKVVGILIAALGVGAIIGIPLGKFIYTTKKAEEARRRTVVSSDFGTWFEEYWGKNYSDLLGNANVDDILNQLQDASSTDADVDVDVDSEGEDVDLEGVDVEGEELDSIDLEGAEE